MTPRPPVRGGGRPPEPRKGAPKNPRPRSTSSRGTEVPLRTAPEGLGGEQVEGRQAVLELLLARRRNVRKIYMADALESAAILDQIEEEARRQRVPVQLVSRARLDRDARTEGHQGVFAEADRLKPVELDDFLVHERGFLFVADGVTDPRNLGAMLRSADGAGVPASCCRVTGRREFPRPLPRRPLGPWSISTTPKLVASPPHSIA